MIKVAFEVVREILGYLMTALVVAWPIIVACLAHTAESAEEASHTLRMGFSIGVPLLVVWMGTHLFKMASRMSADANKPVSQDGKQTA